MLSGFEYFPHPGMHHRARTPYTMLSGIDIDQQCCCCNEISDIANPGWGCFNKGKVDTILADLWPRKRGDYGYLGLIM
jgi:hypothetical protein